MRNKKLKIFKNFKECIVEIFMELLPQLEKNMVKYDLMYYINHITNAIINHHNWKNLRGCLPENTKHHYKTIYNFV